MLSIKEMVDKTVEQRKQVEYMLDNGHYDYTEANLFRGLGKEDTHQIMETLRAISLTDVIKRAGPELNLPKIKEFLAKSGTTGIAGAAYLIPDKIYQIMFDSAVEADICEEISIALVPADQIPGTTLKVDIAVDGSYVPHKYSSGGAMPTETIETCQATLDFSTSWGINFRITNDLIEDSQFDVIEMHLRNAGREMGEYASNEAVTVLKAGTDGDGTVNGGASGDADETKWLGATTIGVMAGGTAGIYPQILQDGFVPNRMLLTYEAFFHSLYNTIPISSATYSEPWAYNLVTEGLPKRLLNIDVIYSNLDTLTNSKAMTDCVTILFTKEYSLLTGRKRWLRIEKYSDPVRDLVGATVTARQDSVTVYNDSIGVITET